MELKGLLDKLQKLQDLDQLDKKVVLIANIMFLNILLCYSFALTNIPNVIST